MVMSDFSPEVEMRPFRACTVHPAIIIGTVRSLWTWLWGRYHVPQNAFIVLHNSSVFPATRLTPWTPAVCSIFLGHVGFNFGTVC